MSDQTATENKTGLWPNRNKTDDWMDDYQHKVYIKEPGWHWIGAKEVRSQSERSPAMEVKLRKMKGEDVKKYCSDITVLTPEQAKEKYSRSETPGASRTRDVSSLDDCPF